MRVLILNLLTLLTASAALRSFGIDYDNNQFLKDGQPFRYVAGEMHYFRIPRELWRDRLTKMRLGGINAVQTYIEWSTHEPEPGHFVQLDDITDYIKIAQEVGLLVILRPGPYICSERDSGGLPYWISRDNPSMIIRSNDTSYLNVVNRYMGKMLPLLRPLLYQNGGPVIMVQVENEYGFYGTDKSYITSLRDMFKKHLSEDVVLFTTDPPYVVSRSKVEGVYATVDFHATDDVNASFALQRQFEPRGPLVNSEFYPGWNDNWSKPHQTLSTKVILDALRQILDMGASVSLYMYHGGTTFGFKNGASEDGTARHRYSPIPTSYDYDAPLSEAGDPTEKYFAIRDLIGQYLPLPEGTLPVPAPKANLGSVPLHPTSSLSDLMNNCSTQTSSQYPLTFDQLKVDGGYIAYKTVIDFRATDPSTLSIPGLRDRAQVMLNGQLVGTLSRTGEIFTIPLRAAVGSELVILIENQGRINFGPQIYDDLIKGIVGNVTLGSIVLTNWTHYYHMNMECSTHASDQSELSVPAVYAGTFSVPAGSEGLDTFLRLDGWVKGVAFINGINIGRYWPDEGPQVTLYVPDVWLLSKSINYIHLFETERAPCDDEALCAVSLTDIPSINGETPKNGLVSKS